jgi:hypothetical protein
MQRFEKSRVRPALTDMVVEASQALARLDADRLEALAISCLLLNRSLDEETLERETLGSEARNAVADLGTLKTLLAATKANLEVMNRAKDLRRELPQYGPDSAHNWRSTEVRNGNN